MIPQATIDTLRSRLDIVEEAMRFLALRRVGSNFVALCPFHTEKTPSFTISPTKQLYHCHGCKAGGDVFALLQHCEGMEFPDLVRLLCNRFGIPVGDEPANPAEAAENRRRKDLLLRLQGACELAALFFSECLADIERLRTPDQIACGAVAIDTLARRGLSMDTGERMRIGYAPAAPDALWGHLRSHGVSAADAEYAGLVKRHSSGSYYDFFRHRIMFPVIDPRTNRVVGFSGRVVPVPPLVGDDENEESDRSPARLEAPLPSWIVPRDAGKYVNSPEGPLFRKGEQFLGLHLAREGFREQGDQACAVLVEGNFDCASMVEAGFTTAVASLGTAFTGAHARTLRRYCRHVVLLYDGDVAGRKATRNAIPLLQGAGISVRVAALPWGTDPDSYLRDPEAADDLVTRIGLAAQAEAWLLDARAAEIVRKEPDTHAAALAEITQIVRSVIDPGARAALRLRAEAALARVCISREVRDALDAAEADPPEADPEPTAEPSHGDPTPEAAPKDPKPSTDAPPANTQVEENRRPKTKEQEVPR